MALNFPSSPVDGQIYTDPTTGQSYEYNSAYGFWQLRTFSIQAPGTYENQLLYSANGYVYGSNGIVFVPTSNTLYANTVNVTGYIYGNGAFLTGVVSDFSPAFNTANLAFDTANAAFAQANSVSSDADEKANAAIITANAAYDKANAANVLAFNALPNTTATLAGTLTITDDLIVRGNATLGDTNTDTLTLNGRTISLGNNQSIDSGTLFIDATNNRVGINITSLSTGVQAALEMRSSAGWYHNSSSHGGLYSLFTSIGGPVFTIRTDNGSPQLRFVTSGNNIVFLPAAGNVGIGITSPTSNLHVIGTTNITSSLTVATINIVPAIVFSTDAANAAFNKANTANITADIAIANVNYVNTAVQAAFLEANDAYSLAEFAFGKANSANLLAYETGIGANAYSSGVGSNANLYAAAVGTSANAFTSATVAGANTISIAAFNAVNSNATILTAAYTAINANAVTLTAAYTATNAAFNAANAAYNNANSKLAITGGTITGDLAVAGNLTISGNTVFIDATRLQVDDPLLYLAANNYSSDLVDIGFIANYVNSTGANVHTGLYREHENKMYYLFQGYDQEPINNHIGALSNNMTLAVLNADLITSNLVLGGTNAIIRLYNIENIANTAYNKANASNLSADAAGVVGNAAFTQANLVFGVSNSAFDRANIAIANVNYVNTAMVAAFAEANTAETIAIAAFVRANSANDTAIAAYDEANTASLEADAATQIAILGYNKANAANLLAYNTGIGANAYADAVGAGSNSIAIAAFAKANTVASDADEKANVAIVTANAAFAKANANNGIGSSSSGQVLFNDSGVSNGSSNLTFNKTTGTLNVVDINITGTASYISANSVTIGDSEVNSIILITSTTNDQIIDSFANTSWRSAHYHVTMNAGTDYQTTQISLLHDGFNAYMTEYASISNNNILGTFSAIVTTGSVRLNIAPTNAITTIRMFRTTNR